MPPIIVKFQPAQKNMFPNFIIFFWVDDIMGAGCVKYRLIKWVVGKYISKLPSNTPSPTRLVVLNFGKQDKLTSVCFITN